MPIRTPMDRRRAGATRRTSSSRDRQRRVGAEGWAADPEDHRRHVQHDPGRRGEARDPVDQARGYPLRPESPPPEMGGYTPDGFNALFADGSVHYIRKSINPIVLEGADHAGWWRGPQQRHLLSRLSNLAGSTSSRDAPCGASRLASRTDCHDLPRPSHEWYIGRLSNTPDDPRDARGRAFGSPGTGT